MSENVITLPTVRVERNREGGAVIRIEVSAATLRHLRARAQEWNMSVSEVADAILEHNAKPKKPR